MALTICKKKTFSIIKSSGEIVEFPLDKLHNSLKRTGAENNIVKQIIEKVISELYQGISTKELNNRAFALLKKNKSYLASKYKLKKAIYKLGPTGFPFERFVGVVLKYSGYNIKIDKILQEKCVTHQIDVIATKNNETHIIECKFHSEQGLNCNAKVPLYINSRFRGVKENWGVNINTLAQGWLETNMRFKENILIYGNCIGLYLLSWDYPKNNRLKDRINRLRLYPITVSTLLNKREKQFLLCTNVVL